MSRSADCRIYIGNLPSNSSSRDVEDVLYKYGNITNVDFKSPRGGPPFAFVEFEDPRDAEEAVRSRDGYMFGGCCLRVEFPRGNSRGGYGPRGGGGRFAGGGGGGFGGGRGRGPPSRRSDYRALITGLPPTGSWQDLKDHMREAGDVCYADVYKDGTGVVEYLRYEDLKYALRKLDDTKFRSHEGETSYVHVKDDSRGSRSRRSNSRSRSRSPARRSPSYSGRSSRSVSRSRSRSRSRS